MSDRRGIPRREFVKAAVAIGGASALAACLDRSDADVPRGPEDVSSLPERQHAWNDVLATDDHGNPVAPRHRVLLLVNYRGEGEPTASDRETVEATLQGLERAYERSNEGLLLTLSYSPYYFERFDASLPDSVDLPEPGALAPFEDPDPDAPDAVVHLASDHAQVVLGAEEALRGNRTTANGVDQPGTPFTDVFEVAERRTGFVGRGLPADNQDVEGVPDSKPVDEDAPLYMGFKSGFEGNQATEDRVTIQEGPFAGGSTQHISHMALNLDQWYEQDGRYQRVAKMFCPHHAAEGTVEGTGDNLGTETGMDDCKGVTDAAREEGVVGHSQKMFAIREDGKPLILRRDFNSTDGGHSGLHFLALQREISEFVKTREAMNGSDAADVSAVGQRNNNGILQYVDVTNRGNYLLPPRSLRALPPATPERKVADASA
ncbi:MAG: Tat pathway signal protein [Haloarculaceae archaeon]